MPNPHFSEFKQDKERGKKVMPPPPLGWRGKAPSVREKPAFTKLGNIGNAQPRDRSAGTPRAKVHPKSEGL